MLVEEVSEDQLIGPFFLSAAEISHPTLLEKAMENKVFHYLRDDVLRYGDRVRILFDKEDSLGVLKEKFRRREGFLSKALFELLAQKGEA